MSQGRKDVQAESRNKGLVAGAVAAGAVTLGVIGAPLILVGAAAAPAAVLTWRWWKHRAQNGIKF